MQNRDLQTWLGAEGYAQYEQEWSTQKDLRDELGNKPAEIVEYERLLKRANFTFNKAERYSQKGKHETAKKLFGAADVEFERLLERLQEIVAADPALCVWFDRETAWDKNSESSLHPEHVPQVVTSKSPHNRTPTGGLLQRKQNKQAVKIGAIERELERLGSGNVAEKLAARRSATQRKLHSERDSD